MINLSYVLVEEILCYPRVADFYKQRKGTRLFPSCAFPYEGQPKPVHSESHRKIKLEVRETQFIENFKKQNTHISKLLLLGLHKSLSQSKMWYFQCGIPAFARDRI